MHCGANLGWRTGLVSSLKRLHLYKGFIYSCILFAMYPHREYVLSDTLKIIKNIINCYLCKNKLLLENNTSEFVFLFLNSL